MLPARAGCHNNQAGFVILGSVADDLKRLTIEWMMWVFYRDGCLRIVGIMRLFPGGRWSSNGCFYPETAAYMDVGTSSNAGAVAGS